MPSVSMLNTAPKCNTAADVDMQRYRGSGRIVQPPRKTCCLQLHSWALAGVAGRTSDKEREKVRKIFNLPDNIIPLPLLHSECRMKKRPSDRYNRKGTH